MMFPTPTPDANVIRYRIVFRAPTPPPASANISPSSPVDATQDHAFVSSRGAVYAAFVADNLGDFRWHKHAMHLNVASTPSSSSIVRVYCLEGATAVGDAIDDEWIITSLLFDLTTAFPDDDIAVQVRDADGEFLLIECADVLPTWVTPENSADRVFVRRGAVHLISTEAIPEEETDVWRAAVAAVYDDGHATRANAAMQQTLQHKLKEVPQHMQTNRHRTRARLSPTAAWVLKQNPSVVGAVVEAFYYREPSHATSSCSRMTAFPPVDAVPTIVTMTRCQYAQLKQQRFFPPKPFLHLPGADDLRANEDTRTMRPEARATEMGVKLTCGLELLYASDECDQFGTPWRQRIDDAIATMTGTNTDESEQEDDDAWLYVHPDTLEEKLQRVATRSTRDDDVVGGAEELQSIATMFNSFMGGVSGVDGVESSEPVQFDMGAFMNLLNGATTNEMGSEDDDDEDWDDPDDDDGDSSVDSDDEVEDDDERIMREAIAEMDAELSGTTLEKTFTRVSEGDTDAGVTSVAMSAKDEDSDKPLDLDFNLLSYLLESMASQEGLAGPVSNILSELSASSTR